MSEKKKTESGKSNCGISSKEESYRMAKLIRSGNRELERQLNIKKSRRTR